MLSHTSILNNGRLIASRMGLAPSDAIVCPPPLFHCFGCVLGYMATATTGAAILFPSPAFDPLASIRMAADHKATGLYGVATMFVAMLETMALQGTMENPVVDPRQIAAFPTHLRKGIAAGSSVPESLMRRLYEKVGLRELVICYGMTETAPVSCMTSPADPLEKRTGTVGRVMPHTRVKVVDPTDRGRVVPVGERGELAAAGYLVMKGYWGDEERTREVRVEEGDGVWMYSGDEARMDAEGYVEITGRIKDLIIRGGENIHPLEIENCLFQHPLVAEVSVVGVPDERYGESVGVFVVLHKGEEVREWVRTHLSPHLVPKYVFWVDDFPKTASGKIQKFKLRDRARRLVHGDGEGDK
ncbi:long-chain-fatty-acid-CoA ligase [Coniochaeta ligniaria NRRL 30616]|uniref:Long-chain-fatty-acid-CoA ligase n=1 Tax=Coniochaeta ligniaria NRRL 30616 TaxID=1408157 RepID=A0A1J7ITV6_9PEZI|nr:long-chain-fatty-acid-CoA ligase [Coniochaeta ligniaria NRRL 30616]